MNVRDTKVSGHPDGLPPETRNSEQDDAGTQAQDVAADALREESAITSPLESTKPASDDPDPAPDSKGDLIDEMRRMEGEGRIDMSAFAGEPNHDDEPGTYGGETTDDNDSDAEADWLVGDGENLNEATNGDSGAAQDDDDIDFAALADLIGADNDDDPLPGSGDEEEEEE